MIELYDYINLAALGECVKPEGHIKDKMKNLKEVDRRYEPLKQLINESMTTLQKQTEEK